MTSLLENNSRDFDCINVYVLDNGISRDNVGRIRSVCERYPCRVTFLNVNIFELVDFPLTPMGNELSDASFASYSRLFLATVLPEEVNKVIYFDCDGLIIGSLKDLWEMDISDCCCAGVIQHGINDNLKREFWFLDVDNYINAGFLS